jgi:hypothetical protein
MSEEKKEDRNLVGFFDEKVSNKSVQRKRSVIDKEGM